MPMREIVLDERQFAIFLETNAPVNARRLGAFLVAIGELTQRSEHFGPQSDLRIVHLSTGSVTAIFEAWGSVVGGMGGIGAFVLMLVDYIEKSRSRVVAKRAADLIRDDGVVALEFETLETGRIVISAGALLAVHAPPSKRRRTQPDRDELAYESAGFDYLVTEGGEPIVTEDGSRIVAQKRDQDVLEGRKGFKLAGRFIRHEGRNDYIFVTLAGNEFLARVSRSVVAPIKTNKPVVLTANDEISHSDGRFLRITDVQYLEEI